MLTFALSFLLSNECRRRAQAAGTGFGSCEGLSLSLLSGANEAPVRTEAAGEEPPARLHQRQQQQQQQQHQQTGIDGECLLSGLIAPHLEDLTVAVNERGRGGMSCWQLDSRLCEGGRRVKERFLKKEKVKLKESEERLFSFL